jgi:type I restriction enzyme M protein
MLDNETKRRIDTARDILVGKVPDPKSQVEQITIALVYKFMDDMDKESIELGGKPSFFTGEYERYAWSRIFDPRIGGHEMLGLYGEAIVKLNQNPNLPQLFRDIFKNAYLPYRDPETLKLFLKTINEFSYDHSERLGDAFEYLLSVLGSQGDAGQFRTPRHIIDFMVEVTNPQKNETVLDPACGTAGFLISSYKHILKENCKKRPGDLLNTEERKKLLSNFKGYDISPDMVRLSLVNMYLHGFVQPQIMEYDTLTSEDRWNEYADVILANPPFMSPKGGIKPHKRFSVQSNRSEVLFVDYIAEHLTPTGRAAVIVPEGIIFQSAKAYKALRKMLIENYLYAVVSLPAGVFNPYSGVKTSILLLDRLLAKKTDSILFVKIENDGFGLGAQRREIEENDLPDAVNVIRDFVTSVKNRKPETFIAEEKPCEALLVKKEKLAENSEYNLTSDRYRIVEIRRDQKWPMVEIGEVVEFCRGVNYSKEDETDDSESKIVLRANNIDLETGKLIFDDLKKVSFKLEFKETQLLKKNDILICTASGSANHIGKVGFAHMDYPYYFGGFMGVIRSKETIDSYYLYLQLKNEKFRQFLVETSVGANIRNLNYSTFSTFQIPLPPLEVQREIVAEIEGYQKLIDGCRQVVDSWKPQIDIDPEWPIVKLGEVCARISDTIDPNSFEGEIKYIGLENIESNTGKLIGSILSQYEEIKSTKNIFKQNDILYGKLRPNLNKVCLVQIDGICSTDIYVLRSKNNSIPEYLDSYLRSNAFNQQVLQGLSGAQLPRVNFSYMKNLKISLPPLEVQQEIVAKIESERKVIDGCRELIKVYEDKINRVIDKVWEE